MRLALAAALLLPTVAAAQTPDSTRLSTSRLAAVGVGSVAGSAVVYSVLYFGLRDSSLDPDAVALGSLFVLFGGAAVGAKVTGDALGEPGSPGLAAIGAGLGAAGGSLFLLSADHRVSEAAATAVIVSAATAGAMLGYRLGASKPSEARTQTSALPVVAPGRAGVYAVVRF